MITYEHILTLLMIRKCNHLFFEAIPKELIIKIYNYDYNQDRKSKIGIALRCAAYARKKDFLSLKKLLDENPYLLLQMGDVRAPSGNFIKRTTIYEYALGATDSKLVCYLEPYFNKILHGKKEKNLQFNRYKPHLEGMFRQKPYDLGSLIELIKQQSPKQLRKLVNKDMSEKTSLCKALIKFRKDWAPRNITEPCIHYSYTSLIHALNLLYLEWNKLKIGSYNHDAVTLFWRQVIGFEMRRLPGGDRCLIAQSPRDLSKYSYMNRSYRLKDKSDLFPITIKDDSTKGLGFDFAVNLYVTTYRSEYDYQDKDDRALETLAVVIKYFENAKSMERNELLKINKHTSCVIT